MWSTAKQTVRHLITTHFQRVSCIWSLTHLTHLNLNDEILMDNNHQPLPDLSTQLYLQSTCSRETFHERLQRTDTLRTFWPFSSGHHFLDWQGPPTNQSKTICRLFFLQVLPSLLIHNSCLYADICYAKSLPNDQLL